MIENFSFYAAAIPAVLIVGISKGGFGGGLALLGVPILALVISPVLAAAILLPILCIMDVIALMFYRKQIHWPSLQILLPSALIGIVFGYFSFEFLNDAVIRILIGGLALLFTLNWLLKLKINRETGKPGAFSGWFWGSIAGFTSFIAHAGGPPVNFYLLPQKLDKTIYHATTVLFFAAVNYIKLVPYGMLGLFDISNLSTSLILFPLAPLGVWLGIWLHHRINERWFYGLCYLFLVISGVKLIWDGIRV